MSLASLHNLIGGAGLAVGALLFEPIGRETFEALLRPQVLTSWLFLALGGTVIAFTVYLSLLRDWGPARAGLYAFVSPIVALVVGIVVYGEGFGAFEAVGSILMLLAAAFAMEKKPAPEPSIQVGATVSANE